MKTALALALISLLLGGCGTTQRTVFNEWYTTNLDPYAQDQDWIFISNEPGGQMLKRTQDWDYSKGTAPKY